MPKEYIKREAVLRETYKAQDELESNDDKVWRRNKPYFKGLAWANRIILDTPAADVVEVVRCKDCKYYGTSGCAMDTYAFDVVEEGFCSYVERKEV
jgi:hypothetical protein